MGSVGVIVGRFQVDRPHVGHVQLIEKVIERHDGKVLVLLGVSPRKLSKTDPLDYRTREAMFRQEFPKLTIAALPDCASDGEWSKRLDDIIHTIFPTDRAILYGSRDSFFPHYKGKWPCKELDTVKVPSGTEVREEIGRHVRSTPDFRAGMIYATQNAWARSDHVVDVAIVKPHWKLGVQNTEILLCRKGHDPHGAWGFIGGYVDPSDDSTETTAVREVMEETGLEIADLTYLGSARIPDWRYRSGDDRMLSTFYVARYVFGAPEAKDDIEAVRWVPAAQLDSVLVPHHKALGMLLIQLLQKVEPGL